MAENPYAFEIGGALNQTVGPVLVSAATIAPTYGIHHVSGTVAVTTITPPWAGFTGQIVLVPDGAFSLATGGNIRAALQAVVNTPISLNFDGTYWYQVAGATGALSVFDPLPAASWAGSVIGIGTLNLGQMEIQAQLAAVSADIFASNSYSATNAGSSWAVSHSATLGIWTKTGSSLSLYTSGSVSTAYTVTGSTSSVSYQGAKRIPMTFAATLQPGNYWYGYIYSSASAGNAIAGAQSNIVASFAGAQSAEAAGGVYGSSSNASNQFRLGVGQYSASSASLPATIAFSEIIGTGANSFYPAVQFKAYSA